MPHWRSTDGGGVRAARSPVTALVYPLAYPARRDRYAAGLCRVFEVKRATVPGLRRRISLRPSLTR